MWFGCYKFGANVIIAGPQIQNDVLDLFSRQKHQDAQIDYGDRHGISNPLPQTNKKRRDSLLDMHYEYNGPLVTVIFFVICITLNESFKEWLMGQVVLLVERLLRAQPWPKKSC